ncbi:MAG: hypothetical protein JO281_05160 [Pseudonocardiales bacterium]|nr:hypothetical protein [Pseudonocardiales bacterium]
MQQITVDQAHGALPCRLHQQGHVIGRDAHLLHVRFDHDYPMIACDRTSYASSKRRTGADTHHTVPSAASPRHPPMWSHRDVAAITPNPRQYLTWRLVSAQRSFMLGTMEFDKMEIYQ